ncbi:cytochrome P450 [Streptomyces sp. HNM0574]|uniref:bifunctional cytochrome P450/NADPH--P450 reductase n=1 Tax=Streptomyces sp. HNM0574 TaxID=2714954 RepID=UPI00146C3FB3|nr:cytochrome P450 [Streptomyces sp. HNM0574]NLU66323.1 cytochrome P450 [Streptomyces sp. HNM0574]
MSQVPQPATRDGGAAPADGIPVVDISATGLTSTPVQSAMELARTHGPVFRRRLHGRDMLFVSDPGLVAEIADETRYRKTIGQALENVREFAADGLFTAYNEEPNWARAHDILMPAFALGSMRTYHPVMLKVCRRVLESWDAKAAPEAGERGVVEVSEDMTRMTLDTIGLAGFGFDFDSFSREEPHPFVDAMVRCLVWSMRKLGRKPGEDHEAEDADFRADAGYLASVVDDVITARQESGDTSTDDLLGLMLGATHPGDGSRLDAQNIRNQVITFLIAGHETTSSALSFALYYLLKNPTVLALAQREADELWGDGPEYPEPAFEDVGRLRYTRQVLSEALRLWPTAPNFGREPREDVLLGGRYPLRAGEAVVVQSTMLHRSHVWGDNPECFDPARFTPEAEADRPVHAYKPFGTGERACIGRQFALHEATMLLAMIVHRYRLVDHTDYRLRIKETLTLKPEDFTLTLAPRTPADRAALRAAYGPARDTDAGAAPASDPALPARVRAGTGLLLLHGSNYGTCREFAADLADLAGELGCATETAPLDAYGPGGAPLPTDRPVVLVAASYNGRPTDDAARFHAWLESAEDGAAEGVTFAVLGVGDRAWAATYQRVPTFLDDRLAALGGTRLLPRAEADASGDLGGAVREFTARLRGALLERHGDPDSAGAAPATGDDGPSYEVTEVTGAPLDALAARHGLAPVTVTEARDLTAPSHPRRKRLLRVALPDDGSYRTADHLAVLPANGADAVERAARLLGADPDTVLDIRSRRPGRGRLPVDRPLTVRELLTRHLELQERPTAAQTALLAEADPCPPEASALAALAADEEARAADHRTVLDLIEDHPALTGALGWQQILDLLPPLRTRHYSISSSPRHDARTADLMVSVLEAPSRAGRGTYRGTGSGHLAALRPGDTFLARVQPCRDAFRIPHTADTPVVMIAAGTGLAPFRGAVDDRRGLLLQGRQLAPALLYFGCDHPEDDFLHADELRAAERAGAVSLRPVHSEAPAGDLRFVQHRIAAEGAELWRLLESGARVYVCGDGSRMAPGVRAAFRELYVTYGTNATGTGAGSEAAEAEEWLRQLTAEGRYVEDVYAAG